MDLKRALSKRLRRKRSGAPDSIELPASQFDPKVSHPQTPVTPASESFASIAFDDVEKTPSTPSHRSVRTFKSNRSRSASMASNFDAQPQHTALSPQSSVSLSRRASDSQRGLVQPMSPVSLHDDRAWGHGEEVKEDDDEMLDVVADAMAQKILDTVQKGGHFWAL